MANVFEDVGTFTIRRLRTPDSSNLAGAVRPNQVLPAPVAMAEGPQQVAGPISAGVGASEHWVVGTTIPAMDDVVWVFVGDVPILKRQTGIGPCQEMYFMPVGDVTDSEVARGPLLGIGEGTLGEPYIGSGGSFVVLQAPAAQPLACSCWHPLDPDLTKDGFTCLTTILAPAGGLATSKAALNMKSVRYLGYAANTWDTGALWQPLSRGG